MLPASPWERFFFESPYKSVCGVVYRPPLPKVSDMVRATAVESVLYGQKD